MRISKFEHYSRNIIVLVVLTFFLLPIVWLLTTAFKLPRDLITVPPVWLGFTPSLVNFDFAINKVNALRFISNSVIISGGTTIASLVLGTLGGYAVARSRLKIVSISSYFFLVLLMIPPVAMLVPFYLLMRDLQLLGTHAAVIILSTCYNAPFVVWLMSRYFASVPAELEEAALVDGTSPFGAFLRVMLPLSIPGLVAAALYCIIFSWNDFIFALLLTNPATKTIPLGIMATFSVSNLSWGNMAALSVFAVLPVLIIAVVLNKYFVQGMTAGATKG